MTKSNHFLQHGRKQGYILDEGPALQVHSDNTKYLQSTKQARTQQAEKGLYHPNV